MKPLFWVTAVALLATTAAIENKPDKSKRQTENIRSPQNLQYSLVLPHSRVSSFRALGDRRISNAPVRPSKHLPPYAVQMEPMVQYSQKDPLYDPNHARHEDAGVNKNEIHAQSKILNTNDYGELQGEDSHIEHSFGPPYGALPTAPLYSHPHSHPQYYEQPEPIIEIIIKESNESLPAPPQPPPQPIKKEPVQVFYVKYSKDPHSEHKVIYEKPIPAITPPTNVEEHHRETYVTVTPEPLLLPQPSTTLRTIIKPESEVYHSDSGVKVTFGTENKHQHHHDEYAGGEGHEETAPRPAIAYPQQSPSQDSHTQQKFKYNEQFPRPAPSFSNNQNFGPPQQHAQSRIQFQQPYLPHEQQLPRQTTSHQSFRTFHSQVSRQGPFGPQTPPTFVNGPPHNQLGPIGSSFQNGQPNNQHGSISPSFSSVQHHPPGPTTPTFVNGPPRPHNLQSFPPRPTNAPIYHSRPNQPPTNLPPRNSFLAGPQRPFHAGPQLQQLFNEPKYLQENYHTITTEQVDPPKQQHHSLQNRPQQNFEFVPRPSPVPQPSSTPISQEEYNKRFYPQFHEQKGRPAEFPIAQQVPHQRPPQHFSDNTYNRPGPSARPPTPPQFQNFRPNTDQNGPPFHQQVDQQQQQFIQQHQQYHQQQQSQSQQPPTHQQPQFQRPENSNRFPIPNGPHPSARPQFTQSHSLEPPQHHSNNFHQQNVGQIVPNGGELVAAIPKYEQHITVSGPGSQPQQNYNELSQSTPTPTLTDNQLRQQVQQQFYDTEQEQVRNHLAQNVQKQQEEIQRLQTQLQQAQQQQSAQQQQQHKQYQQNYHFPSNNEHNQESNNFQKSHNPQKSQKQYVPQERSKSPSAIYSSSTSIPYYQSTSRTVEITPTTQRYVSSTLNSINTTPEAKKAEKKKNPSIQLPDEVPDDLRQQLLSSGILDNADISVLDYDKVGDTPLDSLPPDQLANFFSAGGGQQIAASENRPVVVKPSGERVFASIDEMEDDDQESSASENIATVLAPPSAPNDKKPVEMKVVHFDPTTMEGQSIAKEYVQKDATRLDPVALNDKKYNRYLPLKVSGNKFPVPDILKGRKVTSVVVLAPVETEALNIPEHTRLERATENKLKGIKFIAGDSLQHLLKDPSTENFKTWLETEKMTVTEQQSVILLVTGNEDPSAEKEIFMYDPETNNVNKLNGDLSSAFVEAAENNSLSRDIEKLAIEGEGRPESFKASTTTADTVEGSSGVVAAESEASTEDDEMMSESSDSVPSYVDFSSMKLNPDGSQVSISSGYSKTKKGRALSHL